ncbi:MAG: hypothetical protein U5N56_03620 [Candidatus Marinimicrobia bacterium]|nr:hypothetical protein [Candidatus Neomarinimicrobiota bacterium]
MWKFICENLFWIVPSLLSLGAIIAVVCNTNRQIKNQNKISYRPFLRVFDVNDSEEDFFNAYLSVKDNEDLNQESEPVKTKIKIRNMGHGIATNIIFVGFANTVIGRAGVDEKKKTGELFSVLVIGLSDESIIKVSLNSNDNSTSTTYDLMLFYTDLNKNIYSAMLLIEVKNNKFWNHYYYPKGSLNFDDILEKKKVKYNDLVKKYIKHQLGKD